MMLLVFFTLSLSSFFSSFFSHLFFSLSHSHTHTHILVERSNGSERKRLMSSMERRLIKEDERTSRRQTKNKCVKKCWIDFRVSRCNNFSHLCSTIYWRFSHFHFPTLSSFSCSFSFYLSSLTSPNSIAYKMLAHTHSLIFLLNDVCNFSCFIYFEGKRKKKQPFSLEKSMLWNRH